MSELNYDETKIVVIIERKRYSVEKSTLLATLKPRGNEETVRVYRTARGTFFKVTLWSESPEVEPITKEQALALYDRAREKHVGKAVVDADNPVEDA